eukprot:g227.t1
MQGEKIFFHGNLLKEGRKGWRQRWCELYALPRAGPFLRYFKNWDDKTCQGEISLAEVSGIERDVIAYPDPFCFQLTVPSMKRRFAFCCLNAASFTAWSEVILEVCKKWQTYQSQSTEKTNIFQGNQSNDTITKIRKKKKSAGKALKTNIFQGNPRSKNIENIRSKIMREREIRFEARSKIMTEKRMARFEFGTKASSPLKDEEVVSYANIARKRSTPSLYYSFKRQGSPPSYYTSYTKNEKENVPYSSPTNKQRKKEEENFLSPCLPSHIVRGWLARKRYQNMKYAASRIQKKIRRYFYFREKMVCVQSNLRMATQRKNYVRLKRGVVQLQSHVRKLLESQKYSLTLSAVLRIQSALRGFWVRLDMIIEELAAITIQSKFRELTPKKMKMPLLENDTPSIANELEELRQKNEALSYQCIMWQEMWKGGNTAQRSTDVDVNVQNRPDKVSPQRQRRWMSDEPNLSSQQETMKMFSNDFI